jgi:hypothetical protein
VSARRYANKSTGSECRGSGLSGRLVVPRRGRSDHVPSCRNTHSQEANPVDRPLELLNESDGNRRVRTGNPQLLLVHKSFESVLDVKCPLSAVDQREIHMYGKALPCFESFANRLRYRFGVLIASLLCNFSLVQAMR